MAEGVDIIWWHQSQGIYLIGRNYVACDAAEALNPKLRDDEQKV
jgi:hypothetical protein